MRQFLNDVSSLSWWIGVVIVGILVNLASEYFRRRLDRAIGQLSTSWAARSEKRRRMRTEMVEHLRTDRHEQVLAAVQEVSWRVKAIEVAAAGITAVLIAIAARQVLPQGTLTRVVLACLFAIGAINILLSLVYSRESREIKTTLNEARGVTVTDQKNER